MAGEWAREERPDIASERILEAAGKAFAQLGVSAAGMSEIAEAAGCSRGTLYRYFKNRHELHVAYVKREGLRIARRVEAELAGVDDPRERLARYVIACVREVRENPGTAAWFEQGVSGMAARMSQSPRIVEALTGAVTKIRIDAAGSAANRRLQARWLVRIIVSLLSDPGADEREERKLVERYVVPSVLGPAS